MARSRRNRCKEQLSYAAEGKQNEALVQVQRWSGREVVVVMGFGFVGAVMACVVADSVNRQTGTPGSFVLTMERPSARKFSA
jgi:UDP-N-acetyl-D-glucosamine dehydrogenase